MSKPIVAIVGRPNVGKSTLFNRLVGLPLAITEEAPGTTRDRLAADLEWSGVSLTLVDTGGFDAFAASDIGRGVRAQVLTAIEEADVILFVGDVLDGVTVADREVADLLRRSGKPVVLTVNKADNRERRAMAAEFHELGIGDPLAVSALHGTGTGDLLDEVLSRVALVEPEPPPSESLKVAIVGRPNVGKSRLLNALLGEERVLVGDLPGTTRDAVDTTLRRGEREFVLIDTAGIRRSGRIEPGVERYSVLRALRAINRADVVVLLIDVMEPTSAQDAHIASYVEEAYKGLVLAVNKVDLLKETGRTKGELSALLRHHFNFAPYAPLTFISAKFGTNVGKVLDLALAIGRERQHRVAGRELGEVVSRALADHSPPSRRGKSLTVSSVMQVDVAPPTFVFFVNDPALLHFSYRRYLENRLRQAFGFTGTPLRLVFKGRRESL